MLKLPFFLARRFVAGEDFSHAAPKVRELNQRGLQVTLDLLGENVSDRTIAERTVDEYIQLLRRIREEGLKSTISIKLTMMGLDISREYVKENLFKLLEVAQEEDQFIRIDMEGSAYTQVTIELFKEAFQQFGHHVGIVIQAALHRTANDIQELGELGADVRLCKGAYNEPADIALQNMPEIREAFKSYSKTLLEKTPCPRIATHDDELITWTKNYTSQQNIDPSRFEFQMLYGLRQSTCEELAQAGYQVRIYVPYGTMWFPYFSRRLRERKENIWFILSTMFKK